MEITDLSGLGKPLEKLIDVVSKGVGKIYVDTFGVRADANRIKLIGEANLNLKRAESDSAHSMESRSIDRLNHVEVKRQGNIEKVLSLAYEGLPIEVDENQVDDDWISRYFDTVKDISNEKLQIVWAKILTGEIKCPGKYSLRTIDVLKNISSEEAVIFQKLCEVTAAYHFILKPNQEEDFQKYGIRYHDLLVMVECGLLLNAIVGQSDIDYEDAYSITFVNKKLTISHPKKEMFKFQMVILTKSGVELSSLLEKNVREDYLSDLKTGYENKGFVVVVSDLTINPIHPNI